MEGRTGPKPIDLTTLSKNQLETLTNFINLLVQNFIMLNNRQEDSREAVDRAIKQEFLDGDSYGGAGGVNAAAALSNPSINATIAVEQEALEGTDEFSTLYIPLLLSLNRAWINRLENICFPANGDWVDVKRDYSLWFAQMGLKEFLPDANAAWVKILKTENQRYKFEDKYSSLIAETVRYGNSGLLHYYNPVEGYVDVKIPGIRNIAIYPETNLWENSCKVLRYNVTYAELINRSDFNQEFIQAIKPSTEIYNNILYQGYNRGSSEKQRLAEYFVPYGEVRLYDLHIPSLYLEDPEEPDNPFVGQDLYFTVAYAPELKPNIREGELNQGLSTLILKASEGVDEIEHGIRLSIAGTTLPEEFYHQGMLIPFLPHQYLANQMVSGASRVSALLCDPPLALIRQPDTDMEATPPASLTAGAQYEGWDVKAIIPPEYFQVQSQFSAMLNTIEGTVERGSGLSRNDLAQVNTGKRSASEVQEVASAGQLNVQSVVNTLDSQVLRPSSFVRISKTQRILKEQIEEVLQEAIKNAGVNPEELDQAQVLEEILLNNDLFLRLLEFSGMDEAYEDFYKKRQEELFEDSLVEQEVQSMMQQIQSLQEFAESPAPSQPPIAITYDPATGAQIPSDLEIQAAEQQYEQMQAQQREQALAEASALQAKVEQKKFQLKNVKEVPEPSLGLYYSIFIEPIRNSDLVSLGTRSALSKDLMRQGLRSMVELIGTLPPDKQKEIDSGLLLDIIAKSTMDMTGRQIRRDRSEVKKEEEQQAQQMQMENEMRMKMLEGKPGAQPPQIK